MGRKSRALREEKRRQQEEAGYNRVHECPQCGKRRMVRPNTHAVSLEKKTYETYHGETIELHKDICDFCIRRNQTTHFEPSPADLKKVLKAMQEGSSEDGPSLEEML